MVNKVLHRQGPLTGNATRKITHQSKKSRLMRGREKRRRK